MRLRCGRPHWRANGAKDFERPIMLLIDLSLMVRFALVRNIIDD
jgi:hypothetical protein